MFYVLRISRTNLKATHLSYCTQKGQIVNMANGLDKIQILWYNDIMI